MRAVRVETSFPHHASFRRVLIRGLDSHSYPNHPKLMYNVSSKSLHSLHNLDDEGSKHSAIKHIVGLRAAATVLNQSFNEIDLKPGTRSHIILNPKEKISPITRRPAERRKRP